MTDIEARAIASILKETPDDRDRAAEARAGGRLLTESLARFAERAVSHEAMTKDPIQTWHYSIDPSGSYPPGSPQRRVESRDAWRGSAARSASGRDAFGRLLRYLDATLTVAQAEAALDWPIYRAAMVADVYGALWGQASDGEEVVLDTLARCAGLPTYLRPTSRQSLGEYPEDPEDGLPQVYVNVSGGVAEATVTRGEVDVILHDWDNYRDGDNYTSEQLAEDRAELARVANSEYRSRLLADMDEVIAGYEEA